MRGPRALKILCRFRDVFQKRNGDSVQHLYQDVSLSLPSHWKYEDEGDMEACFDPASNSTLRLHIIKFTVPDGEEPATTLAKSLSSQPYVATPKGYFLTVPPVELHKTERGRPITLVNWKLASLAGVQKIMVVATYTVLAESRESALEQGQIAMIGNALKGAEIRNDLSAPRAVPA
jgi:hypothetical protein